jgi:hypothetical protein
MGFTIQLHFFLIQPFFFIPFFFVSISFFSSISFLNVFNTNLGCLCTSHVNWITLMQLSHGLILYLSWTWNQVERFFSYQFHPFFLILSLDIFFQSARLSLDWSSWLGHIRATLIRFNFKLGLDKKLDRDIFISILSFFFLNFILKLFLPIGQDACGLAKSTGKHLSNSHIV